MSGWLTGRSLESAALVSGQIDTAIGERECVDPPDLDPPLLDAVDPGALDVLFRPTGGNCEPSSASPGYEITVRSGENITLAPVDG